MALFNLNGVKISGVSACVPKNVVSNYDLSIIPENEKDLLIKTIGVKERRVADPGVATSDLCFHAAEKLLSDISWDKDDIEILVFVTQTRDYFVPSTATILQDRLGLKKSTIAFDSGLGCSGYVYGLSMISTYMKSSGIKKGLLLVGDISTFGLSEKDKSTFPLFGDAGAATAIELSEDSGQMNFSLGTDGSGYKAIIVPDGGLRSPYNPHSFDMVEVEKGVERSRGNLWLNGLDVFTFSVSVIPESLKELLDYSKVGPESIDFFFMHQANMLINETIRKKMKIASERTYYSLPNFGNTSSASIPLTMVANCGNELGSLQEEKTFLFSGFGVGLSWGSVLFKSKSIFCSDLVELE